MKITLDRTRIQAALLVVPLVLALGAGLYYYFFVRPTYGVFHEPWMVQDTAVRAVLKPVLVQSYVSSLAPAGSSLIPGIPKVSSLQRTPFRTEWIHKMPFEFTFLFDQRSPDQMGVLLYVREHPASESFDGLVNDSGFFYALHPIRWERTRMARESGGHLLASGVLPIPAETRDAVSRSWPNYAPLDASPVTGRHFIEIAVNNQNGALMEMHGALMRAVTPWADAAMQQAMYAAWPAIESAVLTADLEGDDNLVFQIEIRCLESGSSDAVEEVFTQSVRAIREYLESRYGFRLSGFAETEGAFVRGDYALSGFEPLLRRALGGK